jgi:geranylgeranyl diphosphate synthase type I
VSPASNTPEPQSSPLDVEDLRDRVQAMLAVELHRQRPRVEQISSDLSYVADVVQAFLLDGGKRLRSAFCYWGWRGSGGANEDAAVRAAASLELVHACALIHDDVMDASDTRRGRPAVHRQFASLHADSGWRGDADGFGESAAILIGNLCLIWAGEMLVTSGLSHEALVRAMPVYDAMRAEVMAGQYLDMLEQVAGGASVDRALRVARYKSAKYTVERPLHLGAMLAGAGPEVIKALSGYGIPLGEAFQLRDDVLGVFGDPAETGKPAGDDLREGKRTVLIAAALERCTPEQASVIDRLLGDPELDSEGVAELRTVIVDTGALDVTEQLIADLTKEALDAIAVAPVTETARAVLVDLAASATSRRE